MPSLDHPGAMHPALRTLMRTECPACEQQKRRGASFCDLCLKLLADYNATLWYKLRHSTGRAYDDYWFEARAEIWKSRDHVATWGSLATKGK